MRERWPAIRLASVMRVPLSSLRLCDFRLRATALLTWLAACGQPGPESPALPR
jgi:hypothetical protein